MNLFDLTLYIFFLELNIWFFKMFVLSYYLLALLLTYLLTTYLHRRPQILSYTTDSLTVN